MKMLKYMTLTILAGFIIVLTSCNKDNENENENGTSGFRVKMSNHETGISSLFKSDTSIFDEVNVEVERVMINYGDTAGNGSWMELATNAGIYDLLELDSTTVLLAQGGEFPTGYISQMRLILGPGNYVVIDSVAHEMNTPSAQQSGLKLNLGMIAEAGNLYEIFLGFDAAQSVVMLGNGGFLLKPVLSVDSIVVVLP